MRNSSRTWLARENEAFARAVPPGSRVLDAGAGTQPYRHLFDHCHYESADFEQSAREYLPSTYVCDLAAIPAADATFDAIVFNQVMEHLPQPAIVLRELHRLLKPGGQIICTAPLFYEEHEQPYDFYRYTQFGWRRLLGDAGFEITRLEWLEGYLGTVAYSLHSASHYLPSRPKDIAAGWRGLIAAPLLLACKIVFRCSAAIFYALDERHRFVQRGFPKNYVVLATRPV